MNKTIVRIRSDLFKMCWLLLDSSPEIRILYTYDVRRTRRITEVAGVTFADFDSAPVPKFLNPGPDMDWAIIQIWESDSCSDSGYNHWCSRDLPMFFLRKWLTQTPAAAEFEKWLRVRFFTNFWLRIRVRKKNAEFFWSRLRYSGSGPTSGGSPREGGVVGQPY